MCSDAEDTSALLALEEVHPRHPKEHQGGSSQKHLSSLSLRAGLAVGVVIVLAGVCALAAPRQPTGRAVPSAASSDELVGLAVLPSSEASVRIEAKREEISALREHLVEARRELVALEATAPPSAPLAAKVGPSFAGSVPPNEADPTWGCGLLGRVPGIQANGATAPETQRMVNALKRSSSFNKVTFWNWNLAPEKAVGKGHHERLSADFLFMPEMWGSGVVEAQHVRTAGEANFLDSDGQPCPAEMATLFLGSNEPDIAGSCMGNMFGKCHSACSDASVAAGDCPAAYLDSPVAAVPNAQGECNCWEHSHATGVGFWPLEGCSSHQPLPQLWQDPACVDKVMVDWKQTAAIAYEKGYKFLSTPLVAVDIDYARKFIERACGCSGGQCSCTDASCGCPVYVGFHFYAFDCRPESTGAYEGFQEKLDKVREIMEMYDFVKGAIINEIGMLNCAPTDEDPICVPDSGRYPASNGPDNSCPVSEELPNGMGTYVEHIMELVSASKTSSGRRVVKGVSWFNAHMDGGTYNLELFHPDGSVNDVGESYMRGCSKWADDIVNDA